MKSYSDFINERAREANAKADGSADIVMKHTDIRGPEMADDRNTYAKETDAERQGRTGLSSLEVTDAESRAVQKTPHRVTLESMRKKIVHWEYLHPNFMPSLTICILMLENGFALVGKSAPADPENFNRELGQKFAEEDAIRQMWQLEGYALRERLHGAPETNT